MSKIFEAVSLLRKDYPVILLCRVLGVSTSGYYAYLKRPKLPASTEEKETLKAIKKVYYTEKGTYGSKRISKVLKAGGKIVNHKRVARLMKEANLKATVRLPKTNEESKGKASGYVYPNLLERNFEAYHPNQKWVTDMTEVIYKGEKLYISALMDLFNREIIAFKMGLSPNTQLIEDTIKAAKKKRKLKTLEGVLIHSDQGSVYRSLMYQGLKQEMNFTPSMSRKGNCWDNAVIESFFSHLKTEFPCFYPVNKDSLTLQANLLKYIKRYNEKRIHSKIGFVSPKQYLKDYLKSA
ncbi:IS3 family transposase [Rossellomorea vietnamensis]|uniref:IS3 family transposase n=3 Tax=Rossellomorea vietnamensis TaxID=218284 RepID=A0A5D4KD15_9BACI|nr:IS3 family transposase [Rossellomorea vietnamensis]